MEFEEEWGEERAKRGEEKSYNYFELMNESSSAMKDLDEFIQLWNLSDSSERFQTALDTLKSSELLIKTLSSF